MRPARPASAPSSDGLLGEPRSPVRKRIWSEAFGKDAEVAPRRVGQYRIKRAIATGGMGTVYEAEQETPRRTVAVKVLRWSLNSREATRRFRYESEVLARLSHPGIAQVYETGTYREGAVEVPFFAMEYIPDARTITRYATEEHLSTRARLELFAQVCDAVHYGHQHGVIHRDLKPSNILVDSEGRARLIDFGVARSTDADLGRTTRQTRVGELVGTLQYMSPEQCVADPDDIDARSDVYALGVVLFELLCGKLPYDVSRLAVHEATRVVREQAPTRASTFDSRLRGDADTIAAKALEKDRDRRYTSVAELASDIRRYLTGEAILAHPPSALYQLRVFARRNKTLVGGVAAVIVVLFVGVVVSTFLYVRADLARKEEQSVTKVLINGLESLDPDVALSSAVPATDLLTAFAEKLETDVTFPEGSRAEATLRATIGRTYMKLGKYEPARSHLEAALAIGREAWGNESREVAGRIYDLASVLVAPSQCLAGVGDFSRGESLYRESLEILRKLPGDHQREIAESLRGLGVVLRLRTRYAEAEEFLREALETARRIDPPDPVLLATVMGDLADALRSKGCREEAEPLAYESLEIRTRVRGQDHPDVAESLNLLALSTQAPRPVQVALLREALAMRRRLLRDGHPLVGVVLVNLGGALLGMGDYDEAEALIYEAVAIRKDSAVEKWGEFRRAVANSLMELGRFAEAESEFLTGFRVVHSTFGPDDPFTLTQAGALVFLYDMWKQPGQVVRELGEVEAVLRRAVERSGSRDDRLPWGVCLRLMGRYAEAERELLDVLRPRRNTIMHLVALVDLYEAWGRPGKAIRWAEKAARSERGVVRFLRARFGDQDSRTWINRRMLGNYLRITGQYEEAEEELLAAFRAGEATVGVTSGWTIRVVEELVALYEAWHEFAEAARWRERLPGARG